MALLVLTTAGCGGSSSSTTVNSSGPQSLRARSLYRYDIDPQTALYFDVDYSDGRITFRDAKRIGQIVPESELKGALELAYDSVGNSIQFSTGASDFNVNVSPGFGEVQTQVIATTVSNCKITFYSTVNFRVLDPNTFIMTVTESWWFALDRTIGNGCEVVLSQYKAHRGELGGARFTVSAADLARDPNVVDKLNQIFNTNHLTNYLNAGGVLEATFEGASSILVRYPPTVLTR